MFFVIFCHSSLCGVPEAHTACPIMVQVCNELAGLGCGAAVDYIVFLVQFVVSGDAWDVFRGEWYRARAVSSSRQSPAWEAGCDLGVHLPVVEHFLGDVGTLYVALCACLGAVDVAHWCLLVRRCLRRTQSRGATRLLGLPSLVRFNHYWAMESHVDC